MPACHSGRGREMVSGRHKGAAEMGSSGHHSAQATKQAATITAMASAVLGAALGLAGCVGGPALGPLSADATRVAAVPTEVYANIARGAMACWFGAHGTLAKSHIFHAEVDPPWRGSRAHIAVHERVPDADHPWGFKAFKIDL